MMEIRKANKEDLGCIEKIYERIHDEEEKGTITTGWLRNIYPTGKSAEAALASDDLFVMIEEGEIVAVAVINQIQVEEYNDAAWKHHADDSEVMVLHALAVDPLHKHQGYGKKFAAF